MEFKFPCPHCGGRISAGRSIGGTNVSCPICERAFVVPLSGAVPTHGPSSNQVVVYNCLSSDYHVLGGTPLVFGTKDCDIYIHVGPKNTDSGRIILNRRGNFLEIMREGGNQKIEVSGSPLQGNTLPSVEFFSLAIDNAAFFWIHTGQGALEWAAECQKIASQRLWKIRIFEEGIQQYNDWQARNCPAEYPNTHYTEKKSLQDLFAEAVKQNWDQQIGWVYFCGTPAGFFATQFIRPSELSDAGENRCPRCWTQFRTPLAVHPSEFGDEVLGEIEHKRFLPHKIDSNGVPLTPEGRACTRLACPNCRGELPPNFLKKPPHLLSIVGDSMVGKSYFLTVAVKQLQQILPARLGIRFTDGDPNGNEGLSKMVSRLFSPSDAPEDTFLDKTALAGGTYKRFHRHGKMVNLPKPFTYNLFSKDRGASSIVLYDNAGEHFRPGYTDDEKSNSAEHLAWASGIVFLFDPLQHRGLLRRLDPKLDPQIAAIKREVAKLRFDQDVILAEMAERLRGWRQVELGKTHDAPLAVVVGKHDLLGSMLPLEKLETDVCPKGAISMKAIDANSKITREFLLEYCGDIIGAAESVSGNVKYFPASSFGAPATVIKLSKKDGGDAITMFGPNPSTLKPYLVEAPFLWLLSEMEPNLLLRN
jgi:hypothetical protein